MSSVEKKREYWRRASLKYSKTKKGMESVAKSSRNSYIKNHAKHIARATLRVNIKRGKVSKSNVCEVNDSNCSGQLQGHHDNYDRPIDVRWLCIRHHTDVHLEYKQTATA